MSSVELSQTSWETLLWKIRFCPELAELGQTWAKPEKTGLKGDWIPVGYWSHYSSSSSPVHFFSFLFSDSIQISILDFFWWRQNRSFPCLPLNCPNHPTHVWLAETRIVAQFWFLIVFVLTHIKQVLCPLPSKVHTTGRVCNSKCI